MGAVLSIISTALTTPASEIGIGSYTRAVSEQSIRGHTARNEEYAIRLLLLTALTSRSCC